MAQAADVKRNPLDRWDWPVAAGVFAAGMTLYVHTLARELLLGDSAEFQVLGYTLGLAHPTGYPIYLLAAKLVTLLVPVRDIAYRVNLLSAISGAATLALVYLLGRVLGGWRSAALVGVAALGLSKLFWWHAVIAEVYDPAAALLAAVLLLAMLWRRTGNTWLLFLAGLAGALSLGVHYTVGLVAPAVALYLALSAQRGERKAAWSRAGLGVVVGLAICALGFLGMEALNPPSTYLNSVLKPSVSALDLTPAQAASPLGRIGYLVAGRQFQGQFLSLPRARVLANAEAYRRALSAQFPPIVLALAVVGLAALFLLREDRRGRWREALLLLVGWAAIVAFVADYDIGDIFVFYIPTFVPLAAAASAGAAATLDVLVWPVGRLWARARRPASWLCAALGLALVALTALPMAPAVSKSWRLGRITFLDGTEYQDYPYPVQDPHWPHVYAKTIADHVEDNAIVFTDWGVLYCLYYVAHVEQGRTGISVHETYPAMTPKPFADTALRYVRDNYGKRPVYFTMVDGRLAQSFSFVRVPVNVELYRLQK